MALVVALIIIIIGLIALIKVDAASGKKALIVCSRMVLAFLKSAQVLFWEYSESIIILAYLLLAFSNHFVIDYYIMFLFSSLILIKNHTLKILRYSSVQS